jgi:predicted nucleic acid-binding protein
VTIAADTSVAIPLVARSRHDHAAVARWWNGQEVALTGRSLAETYYVLTRRPGDARLAPADAARLLKARFSAPLLLSGPRTRKLPDTLSRLGIAGGAVYDALGALAAQEHEVPHATRDARAQGTYEAIGVTVIVVT